MPRRHKLGLQLSAAAIAAGLLSSSLAGCGGGLSSDAETAAKCAGIRAMFDEAQVRVIEAGRCDDFASVTLCPEHVLLRTAFVTSLREAGCGSEKSE